MLGTGLYTPSEAAVLLHQPVRTVRRWAYGYERHRAAGVVRHPPLIRTELPRVEGQNALTFVELIELLYIRAFQQAGIGWKVIRDAAAVAARMFASEHPFALRQLYADPGAIYAGLDEQDGGRSLIQLSGHGQQLLPALVRPYLHQLAFEVDDVASRWWPMGKRGGVVVDPRFSFGAPIVEDVGIRAETLIETFRAELPQYREQAVDHVAWMFNVKPGHVESALRFEAWLAAPGSN
ncbi:MAG TPA: hypothetical protein VF665_13055 [Longimicrobium sp.]|jgi:uncharacterized protein (DUF433 family)|uniref:hypothetical protein n=1 Tax=Longimicrobium sp. TaxID=2029185 RepID=UPI002EDABE42